MFEEEIVCERERDSESKRERERERESMGKKVRKSVCV